LHAEFGVELRSSRQLVLPDPGDARSRRACALMRGLFISIDCHLVSPLSHSR
jgi:hypothetical protein